MAAKGYTTASAVGAFLGQSFTSAQESYCNTLIERVEQYIDTYTRRGWLVGVQSNEAHYHPFADLYLKYAPVAAVSSVTARASLGADETALAADEDYEVRELEAGLIRIVSPRAYDRILVTYTPLPTVPEEIEQATTELVAAWMQPHLRVDSYGLDSYSLPDLTVRFSRAHVQEAIPPAVKALLDPFRYPVHA